jgi:hypothetical protein
LTSSKARKSCAKSLEFISRRTAIASAFRTGAPCQARVVLNFPLNLALNFGAA